MLAGQRYNLDARISQRRDGVDPFQIYRTGERRRHSFQVVYIDFSGFTGIAVG